MKKLFLLTVLCITTMLSAAAASNDTLRVYRIDQKIIPDFNGSQLVGRTIQRYHIFWIQDKGRWVEINNILTDKGRPEDISTANQLVVIDGVLQEKEIKDIPLDPKDIQHVNVIKQGQKKGEGNKVIFITTKQKEKKNVLILIDGKESTYADMNNINPKDIESVVVKKDTSVVSSQGKMLEGVIIIKRKHK